MQFYVEHIRAVISIDPVVTINRLEWPPISRLVGSALVFQVPKKNLQIWRHPKNPNNLILYKFALNTNFIINS
jgi:hypothetical protein